MATIDTEFKMQMRTRGPAGSANQANDLPLVDTLATLDQHFAEVGIDRAVTIVVLDHDGIAIAAHVARALHHAETHIAHRGPFGCGVVHAQMGSPLLQDRVKAHFETTAHARKSQRRSQIDAAQTLAVQVVIAALFIRCLLKPHGLVALAFVDKFCTQDTT